MPEPAPRHLVLVGMMGSGKTTVARLVAQRLGRCAVDVDVAIEAGEGATIGDLFGRVGEAGFRDLEAEALRRVLEAAEPSVVATGGGAVLRPANRTAMARAGRVVWLRARPETLHARVGDDDARPLLADDALAALRRLDAERAVAYRDVADHIVDVDDLDPDAVADRILAEVAS